MKLKELEKRAKTINKARTQQKVMHFIDKVNSIFTSKPKHNRSTPYRDLTPKEKTQRISRVRKSMRHI